MNVIDFILQMLDVVLPWVPEAAFAGAFIAVVLDALKQIGMLPDGWAGRIALLLNAALWFAAYFLSEEMVVEIITPLAVIIPALITLLGTVFADIVHKAAVKLELPIFYTHNGK